MKSDERRAKNKIKEKKNNTMLLVETVQLGS
jgi:hypothetical protein